MNEEQDVYKSSDLAIVAFLYLLGHTLIEVKNTKFGKSFFIFKNSKKLERDLEDFWQKDAKVEPQEYFDSIKKIKTRIYQNY